MITIIRSIKQYTHFSSEKVDPYFDIVMKRHRFTALFHAKETRRDGNCFYRAIAYNIFANEEDFFTLKLCCIFIVVEYENYFTQKLRDHFYKITYENFVVKHCRKNEWADELMTNAAAILLNRRIISFSCDEKTLIPNSLQFVHGDKNIAPILIGFFRSHFVSILQEGNCELPSNGEKIFIVCDDGLKIDLY